MLLPILLPILLKMAFTEDFAPDDDYCKLCPAHTMCKYKGIGSQCQTNYVRGVDSNQITIILVLHNTLRNEVALGKVTQGTNGGQPSASNMKKLKWNPELSTIAQHWADQCDFRHDECRNTKTFWWVGQNIASSSSWPCDKFPAAPDWEYAISGWYHEVKAFNKSDIPNYVFSQETGHYTQLAWADTSDIGCGYIIYLTPPKCTQLYVCNYGPGGNLINSPMYKIGAPRASCPKSAADADYPGLCVT